MSLATGSGRPPALESSPRRYLDPPLLQTLISPSTSISANSKISFIKKKMHLIIIDIDSSRLLIKLCGLPFHQRPEQDTSLLNQDYIAGVIRDIVLNLVKPRKT